MNERAAPGQAFGDDGRARQGRQQALHGLMHLPHVVFIRGKKNALRQLIVLGLAEQVHRHPVRRRRAIGQHEDFAGAGNHVDAHLPEHVLFGAGHVGVAGAGDLVHARHAGRAVSERGNGLHDHDDFAHARHVRGHGVHQHAGRVGRLAAGHVNAHAVQRRDFLAQQSAVLVAVRSGFAALLFLPLVIAANARGRLLQRLALRGGQALEGRPQVSRLQLQRGHAGGGQPVKPGREGQHGLVAARAHFAQDVFDALLNRLVLLGAPVQAFGEALLEIRLGRGQKQRRGSR